MKSAELNVLFTSSGRRVSLIKKFKDAYRTAGLTGNIVTVDGKATAPTAFHSDRHVVVPRVTDPSYMDTLLRLCREERIDAVIPLIDTELPLLAERRGEFEAIGAKVVVSGKALVELAGDKRKTYAFFAARGIPTPKVYTDDELRRGDYEFPLLIKPANGSASQGVTRIRNEAELRFFREYVPDAMVQQFVEGTEYTIDVMVDFDGNVKTIVPRMRIETRAGEVSKGVTKKDESIIRAAERVVRALPEPVGCITLQCFHRPNGEISFIEINPRFGGGIPLSIEAGADFPLWTLRMIAGDSLAEPDYGWRENVTMLRYDEAVFTETIRHAN